MGLANVVQSNKGVINVTSVDIDGTTEIKIDGGGVSIDGTNDSNLTVTGSNKDLDIAVTGGSTQELRIASAGTGVNAVKINATAGGITLDGASGVIVEGGTTAAAHILFKEGSNNGTNAVKLLGQASTANITVTLPAATDTLVGKATTDTLTNKTLNQDGTGNSITNIANASIKASAAIDATKIANGTVTSAEFQHISTLSSNAQTQINSLSSAKAPKASPTFTGTVVLPNGTVSAAMLNDNIISGQAALSTLVATDKLLIDNGSVVKYITYGKLENIVHDNNYLTNVTTEPANQTALVLSTSMLAVPGDGSLKTTFTTPPGVTSVTVEAGAFIYNSGGYGLYTLGLGGHSSASTYSEFYAAHGISGQVTTSKWVSYGYYQRTLAMCAWHLKGLTQSTTYHINLFSLKSGGNAYIYVGGGYPMAYLRVRNSHQYI